MWLRLKLLAMDMTTNLVTLTAKTDMAGRSMVQQEKKMQREKKKLAKGETNMAMKDMARKATQKQHQREPMQRKDTLS